MEVLGKKITGVAHKYTNKKNVLLSLRSLKIHNIWEMECNV